MSALSRQYVKLCDARDFEQPALLEAVRSLLPERDPSEHVERKVWEFAMLTLFLEEVGLLGEDTEALSVGAGNERILFWLANRVGRIVATDIYGEGSFASGEAHRSMLADPRRHAPYPYREEHLEVRYMDARQLQFPAGSFDVVFSVSSIEHFGPANDVIRAAREIGRVLRPGGYAVVITDCLVRRHALDALPVDYVLRLLTFGSKHRHARPMRASAIGEVFTPRELESHIVRPSGLRLVQPVDLSLSPESARNPRIVMRAGHSSFTSVCLVLEKPVARR